MAVVKAKLGMPSAKPSGCEFSLKTVDFLLFPVVFPLLSETFGHPIFEYFLVVDNKIKHL